MLRRKRPAQTKYFKVRLGVPVAILGVLITIWLLSSSKWNELRDIGIAIGIGLVVFVFVEMSKQIKKTK